MAVHLSTRVGTAAALLALSGPLLTACSTAGATADAAADAHPVAGGTLRYGLSQAPTCADPAQSGTNQTIYVTRTVVDSLTDQNPKTGEIVPWLAESWTVSPDAKTFTFKLRPGVTFSDGSALDAQAVKANFDAITSTLKAKAPLASSYLAGYQGSTAVDAQTVEIRFDRPNAQFLQATSTSQLGIVSAADTAKSAEDRCATVVGSGPFVYDSYVQEKSASVVRRAGYNWASSAVHHTGEAYLDRIDFTVVPESGVRAGSVASGQLDAGSDALTQDAPVIQGAGGRILSVSNPGVPFGFQPNVQRGPLQDPAVRQALISAVNRQELVDTVVGADFKPATSSLASSTPGYRAVAAVTYDPDRSRKILDQAGWVPGADGIRVKDGQRLTFSVSFTSVFAGNQAILELVQQQFKAVGVDLQLKLQTTAENTAAQNAKDFDAVYYNSTRADGDILRTTFGVTQGRNFNNRTAPTQLDETLVNQQTATDATERNADLATAQQQVIDEGLWIPTIELSQAIGAAGKVKDLSFDASSRLTFYDTWLGA
ncbi:ABC transporter substrate-binding protein [Raineyella sp. W15-4]|uniref:ABC transporter substrate-binding protein n=1 Tax=Raineyella sp. W15-4 TaxID=3081651 RepID=UPI002955028F|nr:ABC transporter substrate-binding protein [Raineyella sp. W15-4]WOQ18525.1 ABC transporter substrate-binding protein [Raineyella sp. W15-4]